MPFYRTILKQAWSLTWRHKYLWWFGIFAALLGNGGEFEILFNNVGANPGQALFPAWQRIISTRFFTLCNCMYSSFSGLSGWRYPSMPFAAFLIAKATPGMSQISKTKSLKPSFFSSAAIVVSFATTGTFPAITASIKTLEIAV